MATIHFHPRCSERRILLVATLLALAGFHYRLIVARRRRALIPNPEQQP